MPSVIMLFIFSYLFTFLLIVDPVVALNESDVSRYGLFALSALSVSQMASAGGGRAPFPPTSPRPSPVALPESGSQKWRDLVLDGTYDNPLFAAAIEDHKDLCAKFAAAVKARGFFSDSDIQKMCNHVCFGEGQMDKKSCPKGDEAATLKSVHATLKTWATADDAVIIEEGILDTWMAMMKRCWPLLLPIIPVLLQQAKSYSFGTSLMLFALYTLMVCLLDITFYQNVYVYSVIVACLFSSGPYGLVPEVIGGIFSTTFFVLICMLKDPMYQIGTALLIITLYAMWLVNTFYAKKTGSIPGILIVITLLLVMYEQIALLRTRNKLHSFSMDVFEMVLTSIVPCGESHSHARNALRLSTDAIKHLVKEVPAWEGYEVRLFFTFSFMQFIAFLVFRSCFGTFIVLSMRYRWSLEHAFKGFIVYNGDVFGGLSYGIKVIFAIERLNERKMLYSILNVLCLLFEMYYGLDVLAFRVFVWFCDVVVCGTHYSSLPKYLNFDMCQSKFPQDGAHPWIAMDLLNSIVKHVVEIKGTDGDGNTFAGLGFLLNHRGVCKLFTVNHVVQDFVKVVYDGILVRHPRRCTLYGGEDPVTALPIGNDRKGADIELLDKSETKSVDCLFFVKRSIGTDKFMITYVSKFSFDEAGSLRASVSLEKGDSGGPVFAILDDKVKYAGCTSAGCSDSLAGNFISSVCSTVTREGKLRSDSDSPSPPTSKKKISFDLSTNVTRGHNSHSLARLNSLISEFNEKLGVWFIDESRDGKEAQYFESYRDVVGFIRELDEEAMDGKIESDRKNWWKKVRRGVKRDVFRRLSSIHDCSLPFLATIDLPRFLRDVRFGAANPISLDGDVSTYEPSEYADRQVVKFDYTDNPPMASTTLRWESDSKVD